MIRMTAPSTMLIVFVLGGALRAQPLPDVYIKDPEGGLHGEPGDPRHLESLVKSLGPTLDKFDPEKFAKAFRLIRDGFLDDLSQTRWSTATEEQNRHALDFHRAIESVVKDFEAALKSGADFTYSNRFQASADADRRISVMYFQGRPEELALSVGPTRNFDEEQAKDIRYRAEALDSLLNEFKKPDRVKALRAVEAAVERWDRYFNGGYSMYPWETVTNGHLWQVSWEHPPQQQLVLFHPEIGVQISTRSNQDASFDEVVMIHGLGYIKYWDENRYFAGLSLTAIASDDNGFGFGPTLHLGFPSLSDRIPHVSIGVNWHDIDDNNDYFDDSPFVSISIDFLNLLNQDESKLFNKVFGLPERKAP